MRLLDLFCGAGGAAVGFHRAGFEVVGVDIEPQPRYPFEFIRADALTVSHSGFDAVHLSPPCPRYSVLSKSWNGDPDSHPDLIDAIRTLLEASGRPYVIENVVGAPLRDPVRLCGSMFDLPIERHRLFETNWPLAQPRCNHARQRALWPGGFPALRSGREGKRARVVGVFGTGGGAAKDIDLWRWAMGIDWMTRRELANAIPPAYTEYVGRRLAAVV